MIDTSSAATPAVASSASSSRSATAAMALLAILFGSFLIYGVGFAQPSAIHNAAHDNRHSFAFPCH